MARKILGPVLLVLILGAAFSAVFALDIGISPPDINLTLNRGEAYQGDIYIFGSDQETVEISSYTMDWSLTTDGNYQFLPTGTLKRSVSPWITFNLKNFSLLPKRGQKVQYTIKVPNTASGSYWGTLMFATNPTSLPNKQQLQIGMAGRVAYIIRLDIAGSAPGVGSVERFKLTWDSTSRKLGALLKVKNSGNSFVKFKGRLELKDSQGKTAGVIPFREGYVLPDYSREFVLQDYDLKLAPGFYVGLAIADFGERSLKAVQATVEIKK